MATEIFEVGYIFSIQGAELDRNLATHFSSLCPFGQRYIIVLSMVLLTNNTSVQCYLITS